jgi:ribosome modulation factor
MQNRLVPQQSQHPPQQMQNGLVLRQQSQQPPQQMQNRSELTQQWHEGKQHVNNKSNNICDYKEREKKEKWSNK